MAEHRINYPTSMEVAKQEKKNLNLEYQRALEEIPRPLTTEELREFKKHLDARYKGVIGVKVIAF